MLAKHGLIMRLGHLPTASNCYSLGKADIRIHLKKNTSAGIVVVVSADSVFSEPRQTSVAVVILASLTQSKLTCGIPLRNNGWPEGQKSATLRLIRTKMEPSHHQYQPLENHAIRILTLDPGQPDDRLVGALESVSIDSKGDYEALSYVWAEPGPPRSAYIIVIRDQDGKERTLALRGGSIFAALCRLRLPDRPRRIWADQCCINQDDPVERGHQVQYMNRIYRDATHVLVWLGLDMKREAALAFGLMHELHEFLGSAPIDGKPRKVETERLERHVKENHEAIQALTDRAWVC
jgi:hypothetical protein